uniref:Uncharacterized protein n=1 Tax=Chlamydomonas leiostraca TaxID=1034604 RepID=A0A7S0WPN2_9CHLO|mmetsp:Transcript_2166/g.5490  ORF Transcript_2166/g.5490 Transcript_2166/m.5490 type:complete len:1442 (+) Transcript_2166:150-4475(+)
MAVEAAWLLVPAVVLLVTWVFWKWRSRGVQAGLVQSSDNTPRPSLQAAPAPSTKHTTGTKASNKAVESSSTPHGDVSTHQPGSQGRTDKQGPHTPPQLSKNKSGKRGQVGGPQNKSKGEDMLATSGQGNMHRVGSKQGMSKQGSAVSLHAQAEPGGTQHASHDGFLLMPPDKLYAAATEDRAATPSLGRIKAPKPTAAASKSASPTVSVPLATRHKHVASLDAGIAPLDEAAAPVATGSSTDWQASSSTHVDRRSRTSSPQRPIGQCTGAKVEQDSVHHRDVGVQIELNSLSAQRSVVDMDSQSLPPTPVEHAASSNALHPALGMPLAGDSVSSMHPLLSKGLQQSHAGSSGASTSANVPLPTLNYHMPTAAALRAPNVYPTDAVLAMRTDVLHSQGSHGKGTGPSAPGVSPTNSSPTTLPPAACKGRDAGPSMDGGATTVSMGRTSSSGASTALVSPSGSSGTKAKKEKKSNPIASIGSSLLATIREKSASGNFSLLHGSDSKDKPRAMFSGKDGEKRAIFRTNKVSPTPTFYAMVHPKPPPSPQQAQQQEMKKQSTDLPPKPPPWAHYQQASASSLYPTSPEYGADDGHASRVSISSYKSAISTWPAPAPAGAANSGKDSGSDSENPRLRHHASGLAPLFIDARSDLGGIMPIVPSPAQSSFASASATPSMVAAAERGRVQAATSGGDDRLGPEDEELAPNNLASTPTSSAFLSAAGTNTQHSQQLSGYLMSSDGADPHSSAFSMLTASNSMKRGGAPGHHLQVGHGVLNTHLAPHQLAPGPETPRSGPSARVSACGAGPHADVATCPTTPTRMSTANSSVFSSPPQHPAASGTEKSANTGSPLKSLWSMPAPFAQPLANVQKEQQQESRVRRTLPTIPSVTPPEEGGQPAEGDFLDKFRSARPTNLASVDSLDVDLSQLPALTTALGMEEDEEGADGKATGTGTRVISRSIADALAAEQQRGTAATALAAAGAWADAEGGSQLGVGAGSAPSQLALPDMMGWVSAQRQGASKGAAPPPSLEKQSDVGAHPAHRQPDDLVLPDDLQDDEPHAPRGGEEEYDEQMEGGEYDGMVDTETNVNHAIQLAQQLEEVAQWLRMQSGGTITSPPATGQPTSILSRNQMSGDGSVPAPPVGPDMLSTQLNAARALLNTLAVVYSNGEGSVGQAAMAAATNAATLAARELLASALAAANGQAGSAGSAPVQHTTHTAHAHGMPTAMPISATTLPSAPQPPMSPGGGPTAVPLQTYPVGMHPGPAGSLRLQTQGMPGQPGVGMPPGMVLMSPSMQRVAHSPQMVMAGGAPSPVGAGPQGLQVVVPGMGPAQLVNVNGNMVLLPQTLQLLPMHMHPHRDPYTTNLTSTVVSIKHGTHVPGAPVSMAGAGSTPPAASSPSDTNPGASLAAGSHDGADHRSSQAGGSSPGHQQRMEQLLKSIRGDDARALS